MKKVIVFLVFITSCWGASLHIPKQSKANVPMLDGRIVGGSATVIQNFPYQLSLQYYGQHICGASILSPVVALTAAHCTDGSSSQALSVRAGSTYQGQGGQVSYVSKVAQNPNYNSRNVDYDISLLILSQSFSYESAIQPVRLPSQNQNIPVSTKALVSGWGTTSEGGTSPVQLRYTNVPVISRTDCRNAYGYSAITDRMLCAGYTSGGQDACQGDSGGPLVANGEQIGIVSWGYGCARPNYPGVYASVPNLRYYIAQVSGI